MTYFTVNVYLKEMSLKSDEFYLPTHCHALKIIQFLN